MKTRFEFTVDLAQKYAQIDGKSFYTYRPRPGGPRSGEIYNTIHWTSFDVAATAQGWFVQ